jgi:peptidoglycan/LPS O-acetylase OafA/YrhL
LSSGYLGVDAFLVLSGFVIARSYEHTLRTTRGCAVFLIRRVGRLLPLQVASALIFIGAKNCLALVKPIAIWTGQGRWFSHPGIINWFVPRARDLVASATLTNGFGMLHANQLNYPSWAVSTEFYTYVLFALLVLAVPLGRELGLWLVVAASSYALAVWASVALLKCEGGCFNLSTDYGMARSMAGFFAGAAVWLASVRRPAILRGAVRTQSLAATAAIALLGASMVWLRAALLAPFVSMWLILSLAGDSGSVAGFLKSPPVCRLGRLSFSIYMLHASVLLLFEFPYHSQTNPVVRTVVMLAYLLSIVGASEITYAMVELPCRRRLNTWAEKYAGTIIPART